jgi:hypothetical protein
VVRINMRDLGTEELNDGIHAVRVSKADERASRAGNAYLGIELVDAESGRFVLFDNLMLAGAGAAFTRKKLQALGVESDFNGELNPQELVGMTAFVATVWEEYEGKRRLKVDVSVGGAGYYPAAEPPQGFEPIQKRPEVGAGELDGEITPF